MEQVESVRILQTDKLLALNDKELRRFAVANGLDFNAITGLTLGYGIVLVQPDASPKLKAHELSHVCQREQAGSFVAFVEEYISQLLTYGYDQAPYEVDARAAEQSV